MINIVEDVSKITTIPKSYLDKLNEKAVWCICDGIQDELIQGNNIIELDIGIGTLLISSEQENIRYKFIPSEYLEKSINETVTYEHSPLQDQLEQSLINKIVNTYKDIL